MLSKNTKVINDTIHGMVRLEGVRRELLRTPELNKLSHIKQLGLAHLVFPGAHHTRFEHSIGASHLAGMMADSVQLDEHEKQLVQTAAILHDVGHGPYSHTLEHILAERGGVDHMTITQGIILGEYDIVNEGEEKALDQRKSIPEILESHGLEPAAVADLIRGPDAGGSERDLFTWDGVAEAFTSKDVTLPGMIHGVVDCDQMDYLLRDSHFTGVRHGVIDHFRLISSLKRKAGNLAITEGGLSSLEGMLMARGLMYSAVYFHRVTRITEMMLSRAVERMDTTALDLQRMVDAEIWQVLAEAGTYQHDILKRVKYRQMFKIATSYRPKDLNENQVKLLVEIANDSVKRQAVEDEICQRAGLEPGYVAIDVPSVKLLLSEQRMEMVDMKVEGDDGKTRWFREHTPVAEALRQRQVSQVACYVATLPTYQKRVTQLVNEEILGE